RRPANRVLTRCSLPHSGQMTSMDRLATTRLLLYDRDVGVVEALKRVADDRLDAGDLRHLDVLIAEDHHLVLATIELVGQVFDDFTDLEFLVGTELVAVDIADDRRLGIAGRDEDHGGVLR